MKNAKENQKPAEKTPTRKAYRVHDDILLAMKRSANKFFVFEAVLQNKDMKNKERVERFIVQKKAPTESEMKSWNTDMISYYKQRKAQMIDKGEEDNCENNSNVKQMDDVYKDDTGIAECMKNDGVKDLQIQKRIVGDKAWIMMGDMNVTLTPNEHSFGGLNMTSNMNEFKESVNSIEMKDIASSGLFFTWTKNLCKTKAGNNTGVLKKLDIVMWNEDFIDNFSQAHVIFLLYLISNHCLIVTVWPSVIQAKKKSFKFANFIRDRNNAYFYRVLKSRNHKSRINHIRDSEGNLFHREKVPNQFVKHFQEFLGKVVLAIDFESSSHLIKKKLSDYAANFMIMRHIQDNILLSQEPLKGYDRKDGLNRVAMESFRYFKGGRGLRNGDPLSPYIFTLVMEMLSLIVQDRVEKRKEFKYHFGCKNLKLTHVCFADDLLMFCNGDKGYTVITDINRLLKGFLWNQRELFKGKASVAWKEICRPKSQGGMGLKDLGVWNNAMIAKHLWHVATEKVSLWTNVLHFLNIKDDVSKNDELVWRSKKGKECRFNVKQVMKILEEVVMMLNEEFWGIAKHKIGANYPELEWNELVDLIADLYSGNSIDSIIRRLGLAVSVYLM
nr:RNA-directed DNA polymerase, eukaryota, reverse transcriptase zinc-binding domain protein [Tanacetum cinerariifolium]